MKEWEAFNALKKKIDDFNETCPLLEMMTNKAMLERHWKRMEELTGHTFDVEAESFQLRNIMEAPLLQYREDIEVGGSRDGWVGVACVQVKECIGCYYDASSRISSPQIS